jgi:purine nucleosidase
VVRIHVDTDIGSDTDDACALAMLLGWSGVEIVAVTTTIDPGGRRAGFVGQCLELAGRVDIPVAAGASVSMTTGQFPGTIPDDTRYWNRPVPARPSRPGDAVTLLRRSIEVGATIVAIGPYTNLAALESFRPGSLGRAPIVLMGGFVHPMGPGLPDWGPEMDWNVQCDTDAAAVVFAAAAQATLVTIPAACQAHLRRSHLGRLRVAGPVGALLARQAEAYSVDGGIAEVARAHVGLPDDLLNFQYDAVACAVAAGWSGATIEEMGLSAVLDDGLLRFEPDARGRPTRVVVDIDVDDFTSCWFEAIERPS